MKSSHLFLSTALLSVHPALAFRRDRHHNRLDIPYQAPSIQNKQAAYSLRDLGISYPAKRSVPPVQDGWHMGGCIYDSNDRIMKDFGIKMPNDTPANCVSLCDGKKYMYAGVEHGDECWCSNGFNGSPTSAPMEECHMPCAGDSGLPCGGAYRMLWFTKDSNTNTPSTSPSFSPMVSKDVDSSLPQGWAHLECIRDHETPKRMLPAHHIKSLDMTPSNCALTCGGLGYRLAGLQDGSECWCDEQYNPEASAIEQITGDAEHCGKPCTGDHSRRCGDGWVMDVYRYTPPAGHQKRAENTDWQEGPCMVDQKVPRLLDTLAATASTNEQMSSSKCLDRCTSQGMDLAGLQGGSECWCGKSLTLNPGEQPWAREANPEECSTPCGGESDDTCGGPWRLRLFGSNGALQRYGFGFTRSSAGSSSHSPSASAQANQPSQTQEALLALPTLSLDLPDLNILGGANPLPDANSESITNKKVIAHHMVGNTYPYKVQNWLADIKLAKDAGIDGFALNLGAGGNDWQASRVADAFTAAGTMGGFGMIFSFDMTVLPCQSQADANTLRNYLKQFGTHPGHLTIAPTTGSPFQRIVVSTFAGEYCTFGTGSVRDGWLSVIKDADVVNKLHAMGREIAFVPSWFARVESRKQEFTGVVQGDFHWNGGWPAGNNDINWSTDQYRLQYNPGPLYMASVSPWFFTHYGPNSFNKNWIYRGDDWLYAERWELLFQHRSQVDLVEIVTWNDYGESSYIGPIEGDQPNSQAWVNGYSHLGFLDMTSYYAAAYKTGTYPPITKEKVYIWSRPHPRDASAPSDSVGRPMNAEWTEDYVWALVLASSAGTFKLQSGSNSKTFQVNAGVNKFKLANKPGHIRGTLTRLSIPIIDVNPGNAFTYTETPTTYNFNNFMASN